MSEDAFNAPTTPQENPDDLDFDAAAPGTLVRIGGASLLVAGLFVAMSGVQLWLLFNLYYLWVKIAATGMILLGGLAIGVGGSFFRADRWAIFTAIPLALTLATGATLWTFYSLYVGLFSPLMVMAALGAALSVILVALGTPGALKSSAAKAALYA